MKSKKNISLGLTAVMLLTQLCITVSHAEDETTVLSDYEFVNLSSVANTIGFLQTGVTYLDEESGIRYSQTSTVDENGEISYDSTGKEFTAENYLAMAKKRVGSVDYYNVVNLDQ